MLPHWPRLGVGPVLPTVGVVVKTALKSNLVPQPPFLATVAAGGPAGGGAGHPCLMAWHHGETALGYYNASGYPGFSMFTPDLRAVPTRHRICCAILIWRLQLWGGSMLGRVPWV